MPQVDINLWAVLLATVVSMVIGFLWYGPMFSQAWMKAVGKTEQDIQGGASGSLYGLTALGALVTAYVLAHIVDYAEATTIAQGVQTGFWVWLGFVATSHLSIKLFESRPWNLYLINMGYNLLVLMAMGAVLAVWV